MIIRKTIKKFSSGAHVIMPRSKVGKEAVIIFEDDLDQFKSIVRNAYLYDSIKDQKISELKKEVEDLKARVAFVERFLTSLTGSGMRGRKIQEEQKAAPSLTDTV